jgi:hypothetical protein
MRDHRVEKSPPAPWQVPVGAEDIAENGQHFDLVADEEARAGVARMAGLRDLSRLEAKFDVTRHGIGGLRVVGRVSAAAGQTCVVTLEPIVNEIDEEIDLVFAPQPASPGPPGEGKRRGEADDKVAKKGTAEQAREEPEPLIAGHIDLGALATEFLILGLDPYPRKPGAVFEPPQVAKGDDTPFAALASLTKDRHDH